MESEKNTIKASFKVSLKRGEVEISGSEDFVTNQVSNFTEIIKTGFTQLLVSEQNSTSIAAERRYNLNSLPPSDSITQDIEYEETNDTSNQSSAMAYENVFAIDDGRVRIIGDIPGKNTSKTMVNIILVYMFGKTFQKVEEITFKELRDVCEEYGVVDKAHFASTLKKQKKWFLVNGSGRSLSLKLTAIGLRQARKLSEEINSQASGEQ